MSFTRWPRSVYFSNYSYIDPSHAFHVAKCVMQPVTLLKMPYTSTCVCDSHYSAQSSPKKSNIQAGYV